MNCVDTQATNFSTTVTNTNNFGDLRLFGALHGVDKNQKFARKQKLSKRYGNVLTAPVCRLPKINRCVSNFLPVSVTHATSVGGY
jgi:hypothetical protein